MTTPNTLPQDEAQSKFEIGCNRPHEGFIPFEQATTVDETIALFQEAIQGVSHPSEVTILEIRPDGTKVERIDLATIKDNVEDINNVDLDTPITWETLYKLGGSFFQGTSPYDYATMTLRQMAELEAYSIKKAKERRLQTTVDVENGMYVGWDKNTGDSPIRQAYEKVVEENI